MRKAAKETERKYGDLIYREHPEPVTFPRMAPEDRAMQFSAFAALTGYGGAIRRAEERFARDRVEEIERIPTGEDEYDFEDFD